MPVRRQLPFATWEPDVFQAEIVIRTGEIERRIGIARDGTNRRIDYDLGTDKQRAVIIADKEYVLDLKRKTYIERDFSSETHGDELVSHLLNVHDDTEFEEIARDGSQIQFRGRINESGSSEVLIFFDESIGVPVRQEFYSIEGESRQLRYSVEIRGFRSEVDGASFQIPKDFRRELQRR